MSDNPWARANRYGFGRFAVKFFRVIGWVTIAFGVFLFISTALPGLVLSINQMQYQGASFAFLTTFFGSLAAGLAPAVAGIAIIAGSDFYAAILDIADNSFKRF